MTTFKLTLNLSKDEWKAINKRAEKCSMYTDEIKRITNSNRANNNVIKKLNTDYTNCMIDAIGITNLTKIVDLLMKK